jgi:hypothetical protein
MQPFDTPPGQWLAPRRALWELGKWLIGIRPVFWIVSFVACLIPSVRGTSLFTVGFFAAMASESIWVLISQKRTVHALTALPVPSRQIGLAVWAVAVLFVPMLYGCIQAVLRLVGFFAGLSSWTWIVSLVPEVVVALGVGSLAFLGRAIVSSGSSKTRLGRGFATVAGHSLIGGAFMCGISLGWVFGREEGIFHPAYFSMVFAAVLVSVISHWMSASAWNLLQRNVKVVDTSNNGHRARDQGGPFPYVSFFGIWVYPALWVLRYMVLFAAIAFVFDFLPEGGFDWNRPNALVGMYGIFACLMFVRHYPQPDYRFIRSLPLRRWQQALLIQSFALSIVVPTSMLMVGLTVAFDWPVANTLSFLVAFAVCCQFALVLWPTIGILGVFAAGALSTPPIYMEGSWIGPVVYAIFSLTLWIGSYAYLYQNLCGDGALFGKRDVVAEVVDEVFGGPE